MSYPVWKQPLPLTGYTGTDEWSSGICDYFDDLRECCCAFWCLSCFACVTTRTFGECLCLPLLDNCCCCFFLHPITMSMRTAVRHHYDIGGSLANDCLLSTFCMACVWCQISREMKERRLPTMLSDIIHS